MFHGVTEQPVLSLSVLGLLGDRVIVLNSKR